MRPGYPGRDTSMTCVRFAAVRAGATIPFERLCIKTGLPRGAHLCICITQETASCPLPSIRVPSPKPPQARPRAKPVAPPLRAPHAEPGLPRCVWHRHRCDQPLRFRACRPRRCPGGRQGSVERDRAMGQPRRSSIAHGRAGTAKEQLSAGRVSPQAVRAHGSTQGHHGHRHKLARLVCLMLTKGQACTKAGGLSVACFEQLM